ncbi:Transferase [Corchorus olitorius]|uniref:Transferase n=1 Tax=Corchorus olitorius TaxID=93759 RepID=A0A1R3JVI0_9ROSI|nr:Transferase [Corchorus olitorius]
MAPSYTVNVLDQFNVSAPEGSVPTTTLPLTYFDMPWFPCPPMQSLFFYEYPHSTSSFLQTTLPILKHSLSLTLQHFFPLAAKLMCPQPPLKPYILYNDGDSVSLTIAESTADVNHLKANYPRDIRLLHPFVSQLPSSSTVAADGIRVLPIMALKVTVFPNAAICIGFAHCHVAADGSAFMHFVRSWSSVCKSNGDYSASLRPFHNRHEIKDPAGCNDGALKIYWHWISSWKENFRPAKEMAAVDKVRASFVLTRAQIDKLKQWLMTQCKNSNDLEELHISTFVVICSIVWICMIKSHVSETSSANDDKFYYFLFAVDCRSRMEFLLPVTYFGNCLAPAIVKARKGELIGENGIIAAAKTIARKVKQMENGAMEEVKEGPSKLEEMFRSGDHVGVSGSPKLRIYNMDFGWGRPTKVESIHLDDGGALSLAESRDEAGGIEVSLVLNKEQMDAFTANFEESLKVIS